MGCMHRESVQKSGLCDIIAFVPGYQQNHRRVGGVGWEGRTAASAGFEHRCCSECPALPLPHAGA
eukprot:555735-Rhodomonas_salina.1